MKGSRIIMAKKGSNWDKYKGPIVVGTGASAVSLILWGIFRNKAAGGGGQPSVGMDKTAFASGEEATIFGTGFEPNDPLVHFVTTESGQTIHSHSLSADSAGEFYHTFVIESTPEPGPHTSEIHRLLTGEEFIIPVMIDGGIANGGEITEANAPWGANVQNLGMASGFDLDIWGDENSDIRFHLIDQGVADGEDHYYLVRTFDPAGLHVKDYVGQLSDTLPQRIDPSAARINNVTEPCTICDYQPGTWTFYVLGSPNASFARDVGRPLKYDHFSDMGTAETEGKTVEDMGVFTLVVP